MTTEPSAPAEPLGMRINPTWIQRYWVPSQCGLRIHLESQGLPEGEPDPFLKTLAILGDQHETRQRERLAPYLDLASGNPEDRIARTRDALDSRKSPTLYQPLLAAHTVLAGKEREIAGAPDFLVLDESGWSVLEVKLARKIEGRHHAEIRLQIECYGWLLEQTLGSPPASLRVLLGDGAIAEREYEGGERALAMLEHILEIRESPTYGYEPVGWSKCMPCAYRNVCFPEARKRHDVSLVPELDQGLARVLHDRGVRTVAQLVERYEPAELACLARPMGEREVKVGRKAERILLGARAVESGEAIRLGKLRLPETEHFAMFDIEGIPPDLDDDLGRIFLWGLKVYGARPSGFRDAVARFDGDGDRDAWFEFLAHAQALFEEYGPDLPLVHWSHYEVTKVRGYLERYGDDESGTAERVLENLVDLYRVTRETWVLPLLSYSLKEVEKHAGFRRTLSDANGAWAMAQYIEAVEKHDEEQRNELMSEIRLYNEEDLDATWEVLRWLLRQEDRPVPGEAS